MINSNNNIVLSIIKWGAILYVLIGIALYFLQNFFLFHPVKLPRTYQYVFSVPFEEISIPFNKKDTISLVKSFPIKSASKGIVIYFHGNKGNINRFAKFADNFTSQGYEVWMPDYPGYGKSTGTRNEKILYQQAVLIYAMAAAKFSKDNIVIYGKSLGTGIAAYLASVSDCKQLILETPYYSVPDLFTCYAPIYPSKLMSQYRLPTYQYLQKVKVPITIFHGTNDGIIPYSCAIKLQPFLKSTDQFITIKNATHSNLNDFLIFHQKLDSLLKK